MLPEITRLRSANNTAGGCRIQIVPVTGVATMPAEFNGTIPSDTPIVLSAGYSWTTVTPTRFTQAFSEDWSALNGARRAGASLELAIAKDRAELLGPLWELRSQRSLVIHYDENGTAKLMGTVEEPALVTVTELQHGIGPGQGANQYLVRVTVMRRRACPFYLADTGIISTPPGCPTLSELLPSALIADIIAALTPEQEAALSAYYNTVVPCPTLPELIGMSTIDQLIDALSEAQLEAILAGIAEYADALIDPLTVTTDVLIDPL